MPLKLHLLLLLLLLLLLPPLLLLPLLLLLLLPLLLSLLLTPVLAAGPVSCRCGTACSVSLNSHGVAGLLPSHCSQWCRNILLCLPAGEQRPHPSGQLQRWWLPPLLLLPLLLPSTVIS